jgi:hypothetical protein
MPRNSQRRAASPCIALQRLTIRGNGRYTPTIVDYSSMAVTPDVLLRLSGAFLLHGKYSILQQVWLLPPCASHELALPSLRTLPSPPLPSPPLP